jgi:diacylglycerol kinase (ATP)
LWRKRILRLAEVEFRAPSSHQTAMRINPPLKIRLIINPTAGRGRAGRALRRIATAFAAERIVEIAQTEVGGDEERLALQAIADGMETIVVVGGDGTCTRVANAILSSGASCRLGVVAVGTGNDFAKTLGTDKLGCAAIARLCAGSSIARMDVGRVDDLYFLNGCGFGIDPVILAAALDVSWLRGNAVYVWSALTKLFSYPGLEIAGSTGHGKNHVMMLTVSNGRYLGGAFRIAPEASVCDGALDIHTFHDTTAMRRLKVFLATLKGGHAKLPEVSFGRHASVDLSFDSPPQMEVDGELRSAASTTVHVECVAGALSVVAAPRFPV